MTATSADDASEKDTSASASSTGSTNEFPFTRSEVRPFAQTHRSPQSQYGGPETATGGAVSQRLGVSRATPPTPFSGTKQPQASPSFQAANPSFPSVITGNSPLESAANPPLLHSSCAPLSATVRWRPRGAAIQAASNLRQMTGTRQESETDTTRLPEVSVRTDTQLLSLPPAMAVSQAGQHVPRGTAAAATVAAAAAAAVSFPLHASADQRCLNYVHQVKIRQSLEAATRAQQQTRPFHAGSANTIFEVTVPAKEAALPNRLQVVAPALAGFRLSPLYFCGNFGVRCELEDAPAVTVQVDQRTGKVTLANASKVFSEFVVCVRGRAYPTPLPPTALHVCTDEAWAEVFASARPKTEVAKVMYARRFRWTQGFFKVPPTQIANRKSQDEHLVMQYRSDGRWVSGTVRDLAYAANQLGLPVESVFGGETQRFDTVLPLKTVLCRPRVRVDGDSQYVNVSGMLPAHASSLELHESPVVVEGNAVVQQLQAVCSINIFDVLMMLHRIVCDDYPHTVVVVRTAPQYGALWALLEAILGSQRCQRDLRTPVDVEVETVLVGLDQDKFRPFCANLLADPSAKGSTRWAPLRDLPMIQCEKGPLCVLVHAPTADIKVDVKRAKLVALASLQVSPAPSAFDTNALAEFVHIIRNLELFADAITAMIAAPSMQTEAAKPTPRHAIPDESLLRGFAEWLQTEWRGETGYQIEYAGLASAFVRFGPAQGARIPALNRILSHLVRRGLVTRRRLGSRRQQRVVYIFAAFLASIAGADRGGATEEQPGGEHRKRRRVAAGRASGAPTSNVDDSDDDGSGSEHDDM